MAKAGDDGETYVHLQDGPGEDPPPATKGCRDPGFAVLFLGTLGVMVYFAYEGFGQLSGDKIEIDDSIDLGSYTDLAIGYTCIAVFAAILCVLWMALVVSYAKTVIIWSYKCYALMYLCCAVAGFVYGQLSLAIFSLFFLFILWCCWRSIKRRIPFAAANLSTACTALNAHKSVVCVVILMIILSLAWCFTVAVASVGLLAGTSSDDDALGDDGTDDNSNGNDQVNGMVVFLLLVAFYWGGMICANVSHVTVAGTVGSWWFTPQDDETSNYAVTGSFGRAMSSSFGSICFGSLLVAILEAMKQMAREAMRRNGGSCIACCAVCLLQCLENMAQYINRYAFVYVGLYGHDFCAAGSHVFQLFSYRGWMDTVLNDSLISNTLHLGAIMIGLLTALAGMIVAAIGWGDDNDDNTYQVISYSMTIMGFLTGWLMACVTMNTIYSAVATVYVAFAESHEALQNNHPEVFYSLYDAWNSFHPQLITYIVVEGYAVDQPTVISGVHVDAAGNQAY